jgi:hypothetical protein
MNISLPGKEREPDQSTFSNDVLKIELCGPKRENLSIFDIPGIFRTPTAGVTTTADMILIEDMVRRYIKDERTIILAVLPAPTDIATQSILTVRATSCLSASSILIVRSRWRQKRTQTECELLECTFDIMPSPLQDTNCNSLTKPDLVDKGGEQSVIDLVLGKHNRLHLGYCIVRNRGQSELSTKSSERQTVEDAFFSKGPWAAVDKDCVGVAAL